MKQHTLPFAAPIPWSPSSTDPRQGRTARMTPTPINPSLINHGPINPSPINPGQPGLTARLAWLTSGSMRV